MVFGFLSIVSLNVDGFTFPDAKLPCYAAFHSLQDTINAVFPCPLNIFQHCSYFLKSVFLLCFPAQIVEVLVVLGTPLQNFFKRLEA